MNTWRMKKYLVMITDYYINFLFYILFIVISALNVLTDHYSALQML